MVNNRVILYSKRKCNRMRSLTGHADFTLRQLNFVYNTALVIPVQTGIQYFLSLMDSHFRDCVVIGDIVIPNECEES
jgi:hypothetical protein